MIGNMHIPCITYELFLDNILEYSPTDGMVFKYFDKFIYRSWLTRLLRDAHYNQSANIYTDSSSQVSEGSGVLMKVLVSSVILSHSCKFVSVKFNINIIQ